MSFAGADSVAPSNSAAAVDTPADATTLRTRRNVRFDVSQRDASAGSGEDDSRQGSLTGGTEAPFLKPGEAPPYSGRPSMSHPSGGLHHNPHHHHYHSAMSDQQSAGSAAPTFFTLTKEDVLAAFAFFDVQGTGYLTMSSLKPRLSAFYPNLTSKEYRFLLEDPVAMSTGAAEASAARDAAGGAGADGTTAGGFTAENLWELIDTYQRLYAGSSPRPASSSSPMSGLLHGNRSGSTVDSVSPVRGTGHHRDAKRGTHDRRNSGSVTQMGNSSSRNRSWASSIVSGVLGVSGASTPRAHGGVSTTQIFDPVYEAFRVFDPTGKKRCVDTEVLSNIMARIGYGELSEEELTLLVRTADADGDGRISLEDFRRLVSAKKRLGGANSRARRE